MGYPRLGEGFGVSSEPDDEDTVEMTAASLDLTLPPRRLRPNDNKDPTLPDSVGRFQRITKIGQGGFAEVFRAYDSKLDCEVALKRLNDSARRLEGVPERFLQEAQVLRKVKHHAVLEVYDIIEDESGPLMVMEYWPGRNLWDKVQAEGPLQTDDALRMFGVLADGLQAVHENGVIHRDIKPRNILVSNDGRPKLTDFGIAHVQGTDLVQTARQDVFGSPHYMAPEQRASASAASFASDIYSLGLTLGYAATGTEAEAFEGRRAPRPIQKIVDRCTRKDPADRFQSAEALGKALLAVREVGSERSRLLLVAFVGFAALMVGLATWKILAGDEEGTPAAPEPTVHAARDDEVTREEENVTVIPVAELENQARATILSARNGADAQQTWAALRVLDQLLRRDPGNPWARESRKKLQDAPDVEKLRQDARAALVSALKADEPSRIGQELKRLLIVDRDEALHRLPRD